MPTFSLENIHTTPERKPIKAFIYGANGVGKSHVGGHFPQPIFLDMEDGLEGQSFPRQRIKTWKEAKAFVEWLLTAEHPFKTLVIDSMDRLEKSAYAPACTSVGITGNNINENYGKGLLALTGLFEGFRDTLDDLIERKGMNIVLIAHEKNHKIQKPGEIAYDMVAPSLHERVAPVFLDWCNIVGYAFFLLKTKSIKDLGFGKKQVVVEANTQLFKGGSRLLRVDGQGEAIAKNRFAFKTLKTPEGTDTYSIPFTAPSILSQVEAFYNELNKGDKK